MRGLWCEGGGGRARRVGGVAGEPACHPGAQCCRLLRLGGGLGLWAVARMLASEPQKWSASRGPDLVGTGWAHRPTPETRVPTQQEQMSSLGCAIAGDSGWDGGGGWQGDAWDFMRTKESSQLTEHTPSWVHTRREHTSERSKGPYAAVHTAALVAIATPQKKPQWPPTDGGLKKMWHRCHME